jgi:glutamyl-tRNA synthetase
MTVITRIAPSPTGQMHIGTVRTALFNYLFAKKHGGTYFVRIEDTDKERNKEEWVQAIWDDFAWCGLDPDAKYRTSDMLDRHKVLLKDLVESGKAYVSKEPAKDDPGRSVEVVRLKNPGTSVSFEDLIRGTVTFDTTELGDFVIARAIDDPLYHFAVVVDDGDAGVTHILRAEEHISNTPRQILILEALGFERPQYAHLPLILAPDRSKLSKRKHGASVDKYRAQGIISEALINYLALLGWNPGTDQEIFSMDDLIQLFDLSSVHKGGAIFDMEKLRWFNRQYMHAMGEEDFAADALERVRQQIGERGLPYDEDVARKILPLIRERISTWGDLGNIISEGELDYFFHAPDLSEKKSKISEKKSTPQIAAAHLSRVIDLLTDLESFSFDEIKTAIWEYATAEGRGAVLWPFRYSLTGHDKSPDPFVVASVIGKEETLKRVNAAIQLLAV